MIRLKLDVYIVINAINIMLCLMNKFIHIGMDFNKK